MIEIGRDRNGGGGGRERERESKQGEDKSGKSSELGQEQTSVRTTC